MGGKFFGEPWAELNFVLAGADAQMDRSPGTVDRQTREMSDSGHSAHRPGESCPSCDDLQGQLARLEDEFSRFVYVVSHDLNAPTRAIANVSGWLEEELDPELITEDIREYIAILRDRSVMMRTMLEHLLRMSRIPREELELTGVELGELVEDVLQSQGAYARPQLDVKVSGPGLRLVASVSQLREALGHLVDNALRHNNATTGQISVVWQVEGEGVAITVRDNGEGVPEHQLQGLRELFRVGQKSRSPESVGGGWAIVDQICRARGARLELKNCTGTPTGDNAQVTPGGFEAHLWWPKQERGQRSLEAA